MHVGTNVSTLYIVLQYSVKFLRACKAECLHWPERKTKPPQMARNPNSELSMTEFDPETSNSMTEQGTTHQHWYREQLLSLRTESHRSDSLEHGSSSWSWALSKCRKSRKLGDRSQCPPTVRLTPYGPRDFLVAHGDRGPSHVLALISTWESDIVLRQSRRLECTHPGCHSHVDSQLYN